MTAETFNGLHVHFDPALTALSALVATCFTFFALIYSARASPFRKPTRKHPNCYYDHERGPKSWRADTEQDSSLGSQDCQNSPCLNDSFQLFDFQNNTSSESLIGSTGNSRNSPRSPNPPNSCDLDSSSDEDEFQDSHPTHLLSRSHLSPLTISGIAKELRTGMTVITALKALIWGSAIALMHHIGMAAMSIPSGRLVLNALYVFLSCLIAFIISWLGCITIDKLDLHLGRQVLFATLTSLGAFSFHYVSAFGVTFITHEKVVASLLEDKENYNDQQIPFFVMGSAVCTCLLSIGLLAHTAELARSRLAELVFTKKRLWKVKAQKLAAEGAADLKQSFISVASHELRTPLFSVSGYADLLSRTDLNEEQELYLSNMQQACANMQLIIANVLDFSKLERNNAESFAKPVCTNLRKMVESICRMTEDRSRCQPSPAVDLIVHVATTVPETALVDETFLLRICMNLLSNALKFTVKGFIAVSLDMNEEGCLVVKVRDTGIGIPRSFRDGLFEPYRQADSSTTRPHQGTGLGLSICKQLVQRLDGKIQVESIEGQGTTFSVTLPLSRPSIPPSPPLPTRIGVSYFDCGTESALVELLQKDGHSVTKLARFSSLPEQEQPALQGNYLDMVWTDDATFSGLRNLDCGTVVVTCAEVEKGAKESDELHSDRTGSMVVLRRHGIIPHLIFDLVENPDRYPHEIVARSGGPDRRESVGTIVTVDSNEEGSRFSSRSSDDGWDSGGPLACDSPTELVTEEKEKKYMTKAEEAPQEVLMGAGDLKNEKKKKILLVDDNAVNVELGRRVLEKLGYDVDVAYNGIEAVKRACCEGEFQLVLMDCQMPGLDGPEATRIIRHHEKKRCNHNKGKLIDNNDRLPIIALTANVSVEDRLICEESGMDEFLPKPLQVNVLKATLHRFLG